jgi:hypothetical protein
VSDADLPKPADELTAAMQARFDAEVAAYLSQPAVVALLGNIAAASNGMNLRDAFHASFGAGYAKGMQAATGLHLGAKP